MAQDRKPLGLLVGEFGDYDMRRTTKVPEGYATIWFTKDRADRALRVCEALNVGAALICTAWSPGQRGLYRGRPVHTGVLVPTEEAERVARVLTLFWTGALRLEYGRFTAASPRVRVEAVELPADPEAVEVARGKG